MDKLINRYRRMEEADTQTHTRNLQVMGLKYDREWEPVYQAFLLLPLVLVALANPGRNRTKSHRVVL